MNDDSLYQLLKSAKAPERSGDYWRNFPRRITSKLRLQGNGLGERAKFSNRNSRTNFAWAFGLAAGCAVILLAVKFQTPTMPQSEAEPLLAEARKCYREFEALFPNQVEAIVFDQQGPRMVLADKPAVPDSTPYFLRICGASGCEHVVTFSGQVILFAREKCEVLADVHGQVMLVGERHVWSEGDFKSEVRIESKPLNAAL